MEDLLPSEIARLVLGYLQEESCEEAAKCFLEKSPHLAECLRLSRMGRKLATKVSGYTLSNILEEFCSVYSIVQEQINSLPPGNEQLKHGSLTDQLKHLFKAQCPVQVKITLNAQQNGQGTSNGEAGSELLTSTPRVRNSRKSVSRFQNALDQSDSYADASPAAPPPTEATPLESLPGNSAFAEGCAPNATEAPSTSNLSGADPYVDNSHPKDYSNSAAAKPFVAFAPPAAPPLDTNPPPYLQEQEDHYAASYIPAPVHSEPGSSYDSSRPKAPGCSPKSKTTTTPGKEPPAEAVDISVLKRALLDNVDLQTRLAHNINSVISNKEPAMQTPVKAVPETSVVSSAALADVTKALDEVIPTIVERTEADPVFERFLEEFFLSDTENDAGGPSSTQENGSKSGKKKNTKATGGKDGDSCAPNTSADNSVVPGLLNRTPAKLEIEAAVAAATIEPMTPMTSKIVNALTDPNATPLTDPKQAFNNIQTSSAEASPSEDSADTSKNTTNQRRRKNAKPLSSRSPGPAKLAEIVSSQCPPVNVEKVQRTNQIMSTFKPIAPRPFPTTIAVTLSDRRLPILGPNVVEQRPWNSPFLKESIVLTVKPEAPAARRASVIPAQSTANRPPKAVTASVTMKKVPGPKPSAAPEPPLPAASTSAPDHLAPAQEAKKDKAGEVAPPRSAENAVLQDASVAGRTPAVQQEGNTRRLSMSTPRRRTHVRTLQFTPPKDVSQPTRKANTSPKNLKALSPNSAKAMATLSAKRRGELRNEDERNSRAKAHLFTSPEYALTSSSGFKAIAGEEDISGIAAIKEPAQKSKKAWDADLRAGFAAAAQPAKPKPAAKRKRKGSAPEKVPDPKESPLEKKQKSDPVNLSVINESTQSDRDLGKLLEANILDSSANSLNKSAETPKESASLLEQSSALDQTSITTDDSREVNCSVEEAGKKPESVEGPAHEPTPKKPSPKKLTPIAEEPADQPQDTSIRVPAKSAPVSSIFDTPLKENEPVVPATPVMLSPNTAAQDTPVTKVLRTHMPAMTLLAPSPNMPPVPSIRSSNEVSPLSAAAAAAAAFFKPNSPLRENVRKTFIADVSVDDRFGRTVSHDSLEGELIRECNRIENKKPTPTKMNSSMESSVTEEERTTESVDQRHPDSSLPPKAPADPKNVISDIFGDDDDDDDDEEEDESSAQVETSSKEVQEKDAKTKPKKGSPQKVANKKVVKSKVPPRKTKPTEEAEVCSDTTRAKLFAMQGNDIEEALNKLHGNSNVSGGCMSPLPETPMKEGSQSTEVLPASTFKTPGKTSRLLAEVAGGYVTLLSPLPETPMKDDPKVKEVLSAAKSKTPGKSHIFHSLAGVASTYLTLLSPLRETPMKEDPKAKEAPSATKSKTPAKPKTPGKSKQKTPQKVVLKIKTPLKPPAAETVGKPKKTPLKSKTPVKSKTPSKSAPHVLDKLIVSAKKRSMGMDPNESSSSSSSSSTSTSTSSECTTDSDTDSSDSEEESPEKNPGEADVSMQSPEKNPDVDDAPAENPNVADVSVPEKNPNVVVSAPVKNPNTAGVSVPAKNPSVANASAPVKNPNVAVSVPVKIPEVPVQSPEKNPNAPDVSVQSPEKNLNASDVSTQSTGKEANTADVSVHNADRQPLKASTPCDRSKKQARRTSEVPDDHCLLSPIHSKEAEEPDLSHTEVRNEAEKNGAKEEQVQPQVQAVEVAEKTAARRTSRVVSESGRSQALGEVATAQKSSTEEAPIPLLATVPSRIATKPTLRQRGAAAKKPVADKPVGQQRNTPRIVPQDRSKNRASGNVPPDASVDEDAFVQKKRELIGTLQSKQRIADKILDKHNAEDLEEKKRRMMLRLKNPPEKVPKKRPVKAQPVSSSAESEEVPSIRKSVEERTEESPQIQKPPVRRSKSANDAEQSEVKAGKAAGTRSKSESSSGVPSFPEDELRLYISSDEEDMPIAELKTKPAEAVVIVPAEQMKSMPPKQRLKNMKAQDQIVKESQLKQVEETKAPPKKRIQKPAGDEAAVETAVEPVPKSREEERSDVLPSHQREPEEERQEERATLSSLDTSINQKRESVFYDGDVIPSPRKALNAELEHIAMCMNINLEDGTEEAHTVTVTPLFTLYEREPASDRGRNGHAGRLERERYPRSDWEWREKERLSHRVDEDRYRKRPRSPSPDYHRRGRHSSRERDSRSSSDPRKHQSSSERSQKRVESARMAEKPCKRQKQDRKSAEEGEVTSEDEREMERRRNAGEFSRRRREDRDEWRRHAVGERQRQNRQRKMKRAEDWSSDEGTTNQRRDEKRKYPQIDERAAASQRANRAKNRREGRLGDPADTENFLLNRNKGRANSKNTRELSKVDTPTPSPSQHVALPPDVESGNSQQSNISTVAVASNSSPENKFTSSRSGLSSGKVRTRGGRVRAGRGHVRTLGAIPRGNENGTSSAPKNKVAALDNNESPRRLRTDFNVEDVLDVIHRPKH